MCSWMFVCRSPVMGRQRAGRHGVLGQFVLYAMFSVLTTAINIGTQYGLTELAGMWYILSGLVGLTIGYSVKFVLDKYIVFQGGGVGGSGGRSAAHQLRLYGLFAVLAIAVNLQVQFVLTDVLGVWYVFSAIIGLSTGYVLKFVLDKVVVFGV